MAQPMGMTKNRSMDRKLCAVVAVAVWLLAGCATSKNHAPVEDRSTAMRVPAAAAVAAPVDPAKDLPKPGAENAGKPGYYTVKPGDTLIRIGLENGQNWKDLVKWNSLDNPNVVEVGQVLRVVPPAADPGLPGTRPSTTIAKVEVRPLASATAASSVTSASVATTTAMASGPASPASPASAVLPPSVPTSAPAAALPPPPAPPAPAVREGDDDINWMWPASGPVTGAFDDARSKGLAIAGKPGDPVYAAADGRVVYAGSGLRGYGNLVILKHNNTYLTAYAHNQSLLVKEDQTVRRGQKIAEMGSTDAEKVQLHFEIRRQGKPIDPAKLLPPR
jgi:lipoprotein NlpD